MRCGRPRFAVYSAQSESVGVGSVQGLAALVPNDRAYALVVRMSPLQPDPCNNNKQMFALECVVTEKQTLKVSFWEICKIQHSTMYICL